MNNFQPVILTQTEIIKEKIIKKICDWIWKETGIFQSGIVHIIIVDSETIQSYNKQYREKNSPTDVLTFPYETDFKKMKKDEVAGEILLCEEIIFQQAKKYWHTTKAEYYKMIIHSLLHMVGYMHETDEEFQEMSQIEKKIATKLFEKEKIKIQA